MSSFILNFTTLKIFHRSHAAINDAGCPRLSGRGSIWIARLVKGDDETYPEPLF